MPNIVFGGRIRSFRPESLPTAPFESTVPEVAAVPTGPVRAKEIPVMRDEALGLRFSQFPGLPPEVWNHLVSATRDRLRDLCEAITSAYSDGIESHLTDLLNKTLPTLARQTGRDSMEALLCKERGFHGTHIRCHECTDLAEYHEDVPKSVLTVLGWVPTKRAYYLCPGGHTFFPQDLLLGIDGEHRILPLVQEQVSFLTSKLAYGRAVDTLERLTGVDISVETAERVTATVANVILDRQDAERKEVFDPKSPRYPEPTSTFGGVGIIGADGGYCRIRGQKEQREFKVGVLGTMTPVPGEPLIDSKTGETRKLPPTKDKLYLAHFTDVDSFFESMTVEYYRRGLQNCSTLLCLADGADQYWSRFGDLIQPGQKQIFCLDFFHARDYVRDAAEEIFSRANSYINQTDSADRQQEHVSKPQQGEKPAPNTPQREWYDKMLGHLLEDRLDDFFSEFEKHRPATTSEESKDAVSVAYRYFDKRRHLLHFKDCIDRGLPIASGMIEGGVRFIGKDRLDRSGTKWTVKGAEAILQLRCLDASKRWDACFATVATARQERYRTSRARWLSAA